MSNSPVLRRVILGGFAFTLLIGLGCRGQQDGKALRWGADAEGGAPYIFKDPADPNKNIGFEQDISDALAKELGRPLEFMQYEFSSLLTGLERGDFDFAMNGLEITPDRAKKVRFSKPYYVYRLQLVVRDDEGRFKTLEDCQGRKDIKIGTLEDTAASRLLERLGIPKRIYPGQVEPFNDLVDRQIDGVLLDLPIALYYAQKEPTLKYAQKNARVRFSGEPIEKGYYALAFRRGNDTLVQEVNVALERLASNGTLRRIHEQWGLWNDDQHELLKPTREAKPTNPVTLPK